MNSISCSKLLVVSWVAEWQVNQGHILTVHWQSAKGIGSRYLWVGLAVRRIRYDVGGNGSKADMEWTICSGHGWLWIKQEINREWQQQCLWSCKCVPTMRSMKQLTRWRKPCNVSRSANHTEPASGKTFIGMNAVKEAIVFDTEACDCVF